MSERCITDKKWYVKIPKIVKWFITMFIIYISWEIFRLPSLSALREYLAIMFGKVSYQYIDLSWQYFFEFKIVILMLIGIIGATILGNYKIRKLRGLFEKQPLLFGIREIFLIFVGIITVMCMVNSTYSPFLYFQY